MTKILVLAALVSLVACKHDVQYADVDCAKLMDHMADVTVMGIKDLAQRNSTRLRMNDARAHLLEACEKEKPTKKMTVAQYDCVLASATIADFQACMQ
jgi:hypothetical protein